MRDNFHEDTISFFNDNVNVRTKGFLKAWFLTSIFHDTAYGVEKMESLAQNYFYRILLGKTEVTNKNQESESSKTFYLDKGSLLINREIHKYISDLKPLENMNHALSRALAAKADHGILSSFALYHAIDSATQEEDVCSYSNICINEIKTQQISADNDEPYREAICKAIALHHAYDKYWDLTGNSKTACDFLPDIMREEKISNVLLMLLVLCDTLSQSGRTFYPIEQKEIDYEVRFGNIHCNVLLKDFYKYYSDIKFNLCPFSDPSKLYVDIVDIVYSHKDKDPDWLKEYLEKKAKLKPTKPKLLGMSEGGWYTKPNTMLNYWFSGSNKSQKGVIVRCFTSYYNYSPKDVKLFKKDDNFHYYLFPVPS